MINPDFHPLLSQFQELDQRSLQNFSIREFAPKEPIISANTMTPMDLFLILQGVCVVSKAVANHKTWFSTPYRITPGDFVGLVEVISPVPIKRRAHVIAKTPVTAVAIPGYEVKRWQTENKNLYNNVIVKTLDTQFNNRDMLYHCASFHSSLAGAHYLHYLYEIYSKSCYPRDYDGPVRIWETHQDLGAALICNVRTIDRLVSSFQKKGLIDIRKGSIYISRAQDQMLAQSF